jgi:menaquinone-specific isochorismate synthase
VAATRPRGPTSSEDLGKAIDLLLSPKDHNEFGIVRENVKKHLEAVCSKVEEEFHKRVIKQARVQHLYTRLVGQLKNKSSEFDLMMKLHPTPAVCGHPQALAKSAISMSGMCLPHPINEHKLIFSMRLLLPNLLSQFKVANTASGIP